MTDLEAMTKLETLRNKERSKTKEGLVQAVMVQPVSFEDKIKRIEMIDQLPDEIKTTRPKKVPKEPAPPPADPLTRIMEAATVPPPLVDPGLTESSRVEHYRRRLAKTPLKGSFWLYLVKEFGAMVRYGARTTTLTRGTFPFTLKLSAETLAFLSKTMPSQVIPALDMTLPLLLKKSWVHLTKLEYNLLAGLHELVLAAKTVVVADGDKTGGGLAWDAVIPYVRLFWTAPDLIEKTLMAWEAATSRLSSSERTRPAGAEAIRTLLEARTDSLSLPDALLAVLMLRSRRVMSWEEGRTTEPGEYFAKDHFDCTPEVQIEIDRAADILAGQLEVLAREAQEVRRIRYFLPADDVLGDWGGPDRLPVGPWCEKFLVRAEAAFTPLLEGTVTFAGGSQTTLFQNATLSSTLTRLRALESQLADPAQASHPELMGSIARVLMNLGKTLVVVLRNRSATGDPLARSPDDARPSDPLPFEDTILDLPVEWAGLSVVDALVKVARLCLQAGRLLGDTSLEGSLEKEGTIPGRASELLSRLARLVPAARLEELKKLYPVVENA